MTVHKGQIRAVLYALILALFVSGAAASQSDTFAADTSAKLTPQSQSEDAISERVKTLSRSLRCVVCQNQTIADSDAELAVDMRRLVEEKVRAGQTDADIKRFFQERYGDFVLMTPPVQANTIAAWTAPFILLGLAFGWFAIWVRSAGKGKA